MTRALFYIFFRWAVTALAIWMLPSVVSGVRVEGYATALVGALVLSVLNAVVRPLLVLFTLPLTFFTLGLFLLVINAFVFQFAAHLVSGIEVASFWSALGASVFVSLVSWSLGLVGEGRFAFRVVRPNEPIRRPTQKTKNRGKVAGETVELHQTDNGKWE